MDNPLKHIYNACDPYKPATAEYYVDCAEARGSSTLTQEYQRHLALANDYLCFLFSGHIGCGKSSELEQLRRVLEQPEPPYERYFPILLNVSDYLDDYDADMTDLLLAIVSELADTLREKVDIELEDNYFLSRLNEIKEFFLSEVELKEFELSLKVAKVKIQRLKRDPDARQRVRDALKPKLSTMLEEINLLFDKARLAVKKASLQAGERPYTDLVLILDNLEKIRGFANKEEGLESQRELFLERAPQLTGMQVHVIYTVPLRLVRADGPQLGMRYDSDPFVLPMVKVIERGTRAPFSTGVECMRGLLARRLGDLALGEAFEPDALEFLLTYSGGHVRNLMTFVQTACTYAEGIPIPLRAAHRAIQQTVRTYSTAIPEHHWGKLAELDRSADQMIPGGGPDYLTMLENLSVLEYINGGDEDPFAVAEPWYAVNPIVRELQKFRASAEKPRS
ncbi:MAG: hypothetical protein O7E52_12780 [Candidatus Poribacteria bacterium]|nr:hypothetical protein [Candidatus Poribacteria bacterium]